MTYNHPFVAYATSQVFDWECPECGMDNREGEEPSPSLPIRCVSCLQYFCVGNYFEHTRETK